MIHDTDGGAGAANSLPCAAKTAEPVGPATGQGAIPLTPMPEPHVVAEAAQPLARNRAPVAYRKGMVANFGDFWRSLASGMTRLVMPTKRKRKVVRAKPPAMPAIARANREISSLRIENARLRRMLEASEQGRGKSKTPKGD